MKQYFLATSLLLSSIGLIATIEQTTITQMTEKIHNFLETQNTQNPLIILDIEALLTPDLSEVQQRLQEKAIELEKSSVSVEEKNNEFHNFFQDLFSSIRLITPALTDVVKELQEKNTNIIAITPRASELAEITLAQLEANGLNLAQGELGSKTQTVIVDETSCLMSDGILFTCGLAGNDVLKEICLATNYQPDLMLAISKNPENNEIICMNLAL